MFHQARLKLTIWYLFIIMAVSITFSLVIFRAADRELDRIGRRQRLWSERFQIEFFRRPNLQVPPTEEFNMPVEVGEIRKRIVLMLAFINSGILVIAGVAGYFLAGRTLSPIAQMVDEQNRFISDASHEFRTPLTSLKSAMEVHLRDKKLKLSDAKKLIADNIKDVNKLQKLSDSLLQLANYQLPNEAILFEKLDAKKLITEAAAKVKYLADKKQVKIISLSPVIEIRGNYEKLVDLLVILLDNAIKYSYAKQPVTIGAKKKDGSVLLSVKDQGIGIDRKNLPFIFKRFYRAENSRSKRNVGGYGLGLSIAKKIAELHGGIITVDSKINSGTTFTVKLPVKIKKTA